MSFIHHKNRGHLRNLCTKKIKLCQSMSNQIEETIKLLKYIKSFNGNLTPFFKHTNSNDIDTICKCCHNLLLGNIPLTPKEKKHIKKIIGPSFEKIKILARKNTSIKKKRKILSENQIGAGIISLLATTLLPILISSIVKK